MDGRDRDPEAQGWAAIDNALATIYGGQEPLHYGTQVSYALGGPDPLDGISAYPRAAPIPHWHFVTYGFSELYEKESDDRETSGYGFELTFRLRRPSGGGEEPPHWPLGFLQNLARYVFKSGNVFAAGHHLDLNGPIALNQETAIRAIAFTADPELGSITTPFGRVEPLQVVGITRDELRAIKGWTTAGFLELLARPLPLLVTDLGRSSSLADPAFAAEVERRTAAEGSTTGTLYLEAARFRVSRGLPAAGRRLAIVLGVTAVRDLKVVLPGRLPHGRALTLAAPGAAIAFEPGEAAGWRLDGRDRLVLTLPPAAALALAAALPERAGTLALPGLPGAELTVERSLIRDRDGKVVEEIG